MRKVKNLSTKSFAERMSFQKRPQLRCSSVGRLPAARVYNLHPVYNLDNISCCLSEICRQFFNRFSKIDNPIKINLEALFARTVYLRFMVTRENLIWWLDVEKQVTPFCKLNQHQRFVLGTKEVLFENLAVSLHYKAKTNLQDRKVLICRIGHLQNFDIHQN